MSDANRTQVAIVEEATIGTTPATPAFEILRVTASNLALAQTKIQSKELRVDRRVPDRITVMQEAGGDIPQEVSYGALDSQWRGVMQAEWTFTPVRKNTAAAPANISAVSTSALTVAAGGAVETSSGAFAVGQLVRTSGFAAAGNNALRRAGAGSTNTNIALASGTVDASPAVGARAKVIGFEGASGDITATSTGLGSTALDFTTLGLAAGLWVWVGGPVVGQAFATAADAGWARISAIAATALTFDVLPTGWAVDAGAAKTIRVYWGDFIREGTTRRSYTIEQQFQDLAVPTFDYFKGMVAVQGDLTASAGAILESKVTYMGMTAGVPVTARFAGATDVAAPTNDVLNSASNVGTLLLNGAAIPTPNYITQFALTVNNTGRRNNGIGGLTSKDIRVGTAVITAKVDFYYGDPTVLTLVRNSTAAGIFVPFVDSGLTKAYLVDLPRVKFGGGDPSVPGIDQDRMLSTDVQALRHTTLGYEMHFQRLEEYST